MSQTDLWADELEIPIDDLTQLRYIRPLGLKKLLDALQPFWMEGLASVEGQRMKFMIE